MFRKPTGLKKWWPTRMSQEVRINGLVHWLYNLLINVVYWVYNPLANLLLTSWDISALLAAHGAHDLPTWRLNFAGIFTLFHQEFQVPKMEESWTWNKAILGWVSPYISRIHTAKKKGTWNVWWLFVRKVSEGEKNGKTPWKRMAENQDATWTFQRFFSFHA